MNSRRTTGWLSGIAVWALALSASAEPLMHPLFQDHAVLQRDRPTPVWGVAKPGERITVSLGPVDATAVADQHGRWRATLPAQPAGGPHLLTARSAAGATQTVSDVLVGDVYLCSGQSNMELSVDRTTNAPEEIANSANHRIRLLTVPQATSVTPRPGFAGAVAWTAARPETVAEFSAACYYFARDLQKTVDVPLGLIDATWGGSSIQAWMSGRALRAVGGYDAELDILEEYASRPDAANARWGALWENWWRSRQPTVAGREPWSVDPGDLGSWKRAPSVGVWESWGDPELAEFNGLVWLRTSVTLSPEQAAQRAALSLGPIDDADQTWVNGRPVGASSGWNVDRVYPLPAGLLKAGRNHIVVSVLDTYSAGGFHGPAQKQSIRFADGSVLPLDQGWTYKAAPAAAGWPPRAPWDALAGLSTMYNAMVAPIEPYGLRGVLWYQGESNTGEGRRYRDLLTALMADWRRTRGPDLPFLVVQLANYGPPTAEPAASGWADVRESQRVAAAEDGRAALAVTIDIGDRYDIHPTNKQEIGRRLARAARRVVYGEAIAPSGPQAVSAARDGDRVVVRFADVEGELVAYSAAEPIAFELCGDDQASCRYVRATASGDRVDLAGDGRPATRVRFCWADSPVCNLYDRSGLPAGPFELPVR